MVIVYTMRMRFLKCIGIDMDIVFDLESAGKFGDVSSVTAMPIVVVDDVRDAQALGIRSHEPVLGKGERSRAIVCSRLNCAR